MIWRDMDWTFYLAAGFLLGLTSVFYPYASRVTLRQLKLNLESDDPLTRAYAVPRAAVQQTFHVVWAWWMVVMCALLLLWPPVPGWGWAPFVISLVGIVWIRTRERQRLRVVEQR